MTRTHQPLVEYEMALTVVVKGKLPLVSGTTHRTHTSTSGIATALNRVESITVLEQGGC